MLHGQHVGAGGDGGQGCFQLVAGVGDELFLGLHVFEVRRNGPLGKEHNKAEHHRKAHGGDGQRDPQQRPHSLYLPLRVKEQHNRFVLCRADQIAIAAFIAVGFPAFQHRVRIGFSVAFGDGGDIILIHPRNYTVGIIVNGEEPQGILHFG